jgi:Zn-dependent protease
MTRNAKPGLPRAVDGAMGAPQRFWGGSVIYNGKKVKIALYLAVFVTRDREGYDTYNLNLVVSVLRCLVSPQASVFYYYRSKFSLDGAMFVSRFLRVRMRPLRMYIVCESYGSKHNFVTLFEAPLAPCHPGFSYAWARADARARDARAHGAW